jgi:hypothetical protein
MSCACSTRKSKGCFPNKRAPHFLVFLLNVLLPFASGGICADLLVILLKRSQILSGLAEFSLLHALPDVPMHEGALGVHEIELVVDATQCLGDGGGVGDHANRALNARQISTRDDSGRLVVDPALESGGAPIDELDGALRLDGGDGGVHVLGHDVPAVHEAAGHVLPVAGVALRHHTRRLEDRVGDLGDRQLLVVGLLGRDDGSVRREHEVNAWVRHQVRLELSNVHVQGAIEAERRREGGNDLRDEPVQVGVRGTLDVEVAMADVVSVLMCRGVCLTQEEREGTIE